MIGIRPTAVNFVQDHEQLVLEKGIDFRQFGGLLPDRLLKEDIHHDLQTLEVARLDA